MNNLKFWQAIVALFLTTVLLAFLPPSSISIEQSRSEEIEQIKGWLTKEHLDVHPGMLINQRARLARLQLDDGKFPEARLNFESALIGSGVHGAISNPRFYLGLIETLEPSLPPVKSKAH